jgi:hypothetical protein
MVFMGSRHQDHPRREASRSGAIGLRLAAQQTLPGRLAPAGSGAARSERGTGARFAMPIVSIFGNRIKRITKIEPEAFRIGVEFTDGVRARVDLRFIFQNPRRRPLVLEILRGQLFGRCFVESGALAWPNGYELCPDAIRAWVNEQKKRSAA